MGSWTATRAFIREARKTPAYSLADLVHSYVYVRWPYLYIALGTGEHPLARFLRPLVSGLGQLLVPKSPANASPITFADTYHGKVVPLEAAKQLVTVQEDVILRDLEPIIPYALARDIVLQNPDHIVALECPCRAARPNPCLPLDVCLVVGEPFAGLITEYHPRRSRRVSPLEAVEILNAEDQRGHVHHAFFKDAMLGRFYAICNCCACCCGAMQAWQHGTPMLASSGYLAQVLPDLCTGCAACVGACQFGALATCDGLARVDADRCMGCGVCNAACPQSALPLTLAHDKGTPLEIRRLIQTAGRNGAAQAATR